MDTLDAYIQDSASPAPGDYAALQRYALRELLHLAAETVRPIEERIESTLQADRAEAEERFSQDQQEITLYRETQLTDAKSRLDTYAQTVRQEYEQKVQSIESAARQKRETTEKAGADQLKRVEQERREQLMEADFLAEGAVERIKQAQRASHTTLRQRHEQLQQMWRALGFCLGSAEPEDVQVSDQAPEAGGDPATLDAQYEHLQAELAQHVATVCDAWSTRLLMGWRPWAWGFGFALTITLGLFFWEPIPLSKPVLAGGAAGLALLVVSILMLLLYLRSKGLSKRIAGLFQPTWKEAWITADGCHQQTLQQLEQKAKQGEAHREAEQTKIKDRFQQAKIKILESQEQTLKALEEKRHHALKEQMRRHNHAVGEAQEEYQGRKRMLDEQYQEDLTGFQQQRDRALAEAQARYQEARDRIEARWDSGIKALQSLLRETELRQSTLATTWPQTPVKAETAEGAAFPLVRFGSLSLDLMALARGVSERLGESLGSRDTVAVPAVLAFPDRCSALLECERAGREAGLQTLRAMMVRLFTTLPAGQVRFTIMDPVGLGESFAGFMHAGDYLEALVGGRIWTEAPQIQQQLEDLTGHMETVIQKYLRNEFETIEEYNAQAGELAEPYRFLVIADFPTNFTEESARRLSSILHSGPRCGVHTLILWDERQEMPAGIDPEDLRAQGIVLRHDGESFIWQDSTMREFPLELDVPPDEDSLTAMMHAIGRAGVESARVEVAFEAIAPEDGKIWSLDSRQDLRVPLGRTGATRLQHLHLGKGMAQHMLIAGKTGSGKSTLLHVMITNLALWYRPDEVELYLIDFKKGVEFKCYVTHKLPHARAVAIESDREFGLSILQRLDAEMTRRGNLFRQAGVQDIAGYRDSMDKALPRVVLMVDEFQVFFAEDDKLAQDASILLEQLVRQGRAFGIHVILGSQTLGGAYGLARSTMGQMAVRIALQCSEADSQLILDDDNVAARLLTRPGEAIYNDTGGQVVGNSPFQTAWLADTTRDSYLAKIDECVSAEQLPPSTMIVFEGSAPADIHENLQLAACIAQPGQNQAAPRVWLGDPVAIKEPTAATLQRQSGANLLMVGQRDDLALHLLSAALVGLGAQLSPERVRFVVLDGSPADTPQAGLLAHVTDALPHNTHMVTWREVPDTIMDLAAEADRRLEADERNAPAVFLILYGLQRYRMLRRSEDAFSLSMDSDGSPQVDARFADLLRDGPAVGLHTLAWADTLATVERTLDRQTVREFDYRVLFQMSAADSSNLIDSPAGNQLGFHRVLLYSEEQGGVEKFRPYAALTEEWLRDLKQKLTG